MTTAPEPAGRVVRRQAPIIGTVVVMLAALGWPAGKAATPPTEDPGRLLFDGRVPLAGKVRGHTTALPTSALRCANCHLGGTPEATPASRPTQAVGPDLTAAWLTQPVSRRGAPPTRYDLAAFCRLLATGIDPAEVLLSRTMPLYELSPTQCEALWRYVTRPRR